MNAFGCSKRQLLGDSVKELMPWEGVAYFVDLNRWQSASMETAISEMTAIPSEDSLICRVPAPPLFVGVYGRTLRWGTRG